MIAMAMQVKDPSLLRFMVDLRDADIDDKQLRDDLMTMLIAGHETTAAVLTWTLFQLMQAPEALAKAAQEIDQVVGDASPGQCSLILPLSRIIATQNCMSICGSFRYMLKVWSAFVFQSVWWGKRKQGSRSDLKLCQVLRVSSCSTSTLRRTEALETEHRSDLRPFFLHVYLPDLKADLWPKPKGASAAGLNVNAGLVRHHWRCWDELGPKYC